MLIQNMSKHTHTQKQHFNNQALQSQTYSEEILSVFASQPADIMAKDVSSW